MSAESQIEPKKLISDLKVPELKAELEKRDLEKGGVKATLIERLEKALMDEGLDPSTYSFNLLDTSPQEGTVLKKQLRSTSMDRATPTDQPTADCSIKEEPMDTTTTNNEPEKVITASETQPQQAVDSVVDMPAAASELKNATPPPNDSSTENQAEEVVIEESGDDANQPADENKKVENEEQTPTTEETVKIEEAQKSDEPPKSTSPAVAAATDAAPTAAAAATLSQKKASDKNGDNDPAAGTWMQSLWIKGISNTTKAADLKMLFSKCGKVVAAKIFTTKNKQSPSCFGYITMASVEMAEFCLQKLNRTNLKGKLITVEKATRSLLPQINKAAKPQPASKTIPVTAPSAAPQPTKEQPAKPQDSQNKEDSPEVIIESVTTSTPAKRPPVKALATNGAKKVAESTPKSRIISIKSAAKKITPPKGSDSDSPALAASNKSTSLHRSSRPLSRRFIPTSSNSYQQKLSRSTTNKYVLSRYNNRGEGATTANLRLHSTQRRPLEFSTSRGAGQMRVSRGKAPAALAAHPSSYRSNLSPERGGIAVAKGSMPSWEREEMIRLMRRKEEEYRRKEEELKMERERERLRFERERLEREKLEVKQLKLTAQLANAQFAFMAGGNRASEADIGRRSSKAVDRPDKSYKHTAPVSSGYLGSKNNKYSEDKSRRDDRIDKSHRSRSRSRVKDGKDTNNGYKGPSSSLSKFGYGSSSSKQQGSTSIDQYNQQVNRFIESSALPAPRSEQHKSYGRPADAAKPDFGGRGVRGVREGAHRTLIDISPPRTSGRRSPRHPERGSSRVNNRDQSTSNRNPSSFGRALLDPLPNPNSAQFRTDPSYASRVGLHSSNGAGRNADEMFGGLTNYNASSIGARDSTNSYRDVSNYQSTPNWVGGGGSRAFIAQGNNTGTSPTASTANNNSWQQQTGNNSFWGGGSSVGRSSNAEWGGNALSSNQQQQPTNQSSRYSFDNKHSSSSYSRRY